MNLISLLLMWLETKEVGASKCHITNKLCHSLPLAGTQTRARLRHYCTRVCAPYLEVRRHLLTALKSGFNSDIPALRLFR